ncbi:Heat shock protein 70 B2-like protein, partial [Leptotrombidium deliense]
MSVIINRNSAYPYKTFKSYVTVHNNQDAVDIEIFQGEQKQTHNNHYLGKFTVTQLPRAKAGAVKILVTFEIDEDGILVVRAFEPSS